MDNMKSYFQSHAPRCIDKFDKSNAELTDFDGHGEDINSFFKLACPCGHSEFSILGYYWKNPSFADTKVFIGPLALECEKCKRIEELINTDIHGYDGELGNGSATASGEGEREVFHCTECGSSEMSVITRFEYPDDLFTEDFSDFKDRESDLFTWFSLVGRCTKCNASLSVVAFECA